MWVKSQGCKMHLLEILLRLPFMDSKYWCGDSLMIRKAGLKSRYHLSSPLDWQVHECEYECESESVHTYMYIHFLYTCVYLLHSNNFQGFWLGFLITLTITQKIILCGQLQEKGAAAVNISVKNTKFELHVALGLLFLFDFSVSGL